jgi:hypothetical protein
MKRFLLKLRAAYRLRKLERALSARDATMTYMLTTLGNISIMWAAINMILNTFIEWNQRRLGVELPRGLPKSFTGKLDHLRKVEKDELWSAEDRVEMREIRLALGRLNVTRAELFHGLVVMTGWSEDYTIHIAKEEGNELIRKRRDQTYADLMAFRNELMGMIERLTVLYNPILGFD